jgi:hypothetical protein
MIRRWLIRIVALASIAVSIAVSVVDAARGFPSEGFYLLYGAVAIVFVAVGWLIAERAPSNNVGALLVAFGSLFAWYLPIDLYLHLPGDLPGGDVAALYVSVLDAPMFILIAMTLILFPDGRLPSPRWRWAISAGILGIGCAVIGYVLDASPFPLYPDHASPVGIAGFSGLGLVYLAYVLMITTLILAAVALIVRWRRGNPVERAQIKWVVAATVIMLVAELVNIATFQPDEPNALTTTLANFGISLVPIAMGVAILRYRLYEIDRIISRSISYAAVTGILALVFGSVILLLQAALSPFIQGQTVAVAASTLAAFALFQPLRRRVQRVVDRRFDRARYDAELTAGAFSVRLRHETDMTRVTMDLASTANATLAPASLAIWLRSRASDR